MPYAFNDDKSKYSLSTILNQVSNLVTRVNNLMVPGTEVINDTHGGMGTTNIFSFQKKLGMSVVSTDPFLPGPSNHYSQTVECPVGYNHDNSFIVSTKWFPLPSYIDVDDPVIAVFTRTGNELNENTDSIVFLWDENHILPNSDIIMQALVMRLADDTTEPGEVQAL